MLSPGWCPRAAEGLRWRLGSGAFFASRPGDARTHVLNRTGIVLLELADGQCTVDEMVEILQDAFDLERAPDAEVRHFLACAQRAGLVS